MQPPPCRDGLQSSIGSRDSLLRALVARRRLPRPRFFRVSASVLGFSAALLISQRSMMKRKAMEKERSFEFLMAPDLSEAVGANAIVVTVLYMKRPYEPMDSEDASLIGVFPGRVGYAVVEISPTLIDSSVVIALHTGSRHPSCSKLSAEYAEMNFRDGRLTLCRLGSFDGAAGPAFDVLATVGHVLATTATGDDAASPFSRGTVEASGLPYFAPYLQRQVERLALECLRALFLPRLLLRCATQRRGRMVRAHAVPLTVEAIEASAELRRWPPEVLRTLAVDAAFHVGVAGESLAYRLEEARHMFVVIAGTVTAVGVDDVAMGLNAGVARHAPAVVGDVEVLRHIPYVRPVVVTSPIAVVWCVTARAVRAALEMLPSTMADGIRRAAIAARPTSMLQCYPLDAACWRKFTCFQNANAALLEALRLVARPLSYQEGEAILPIDDMGSQWVGLLRGSVAVERDVHGVPTAVQKVTGPAVLNGPSAFLSHRLRHGMRARSLCDVVLISSADLRSAFERHQAGLWEEVAEECRAEVRRVKSGLRLSFRRTIAVPVVQRLLSGDKFRELSSQFRLVELKPLETIISRAMYADRVIVLMDGVAKFDDGRVWTVGQAVGYSSVVTHRWTNSAVAVSSVLLSTLTRDKYIHFLEKWGILHRVRNTILQRMFPAAFDAAEVAQATEWTASSPCVFPIFPLERRVDVSLFGLGYRTERFDILPTFRADGGGEKKKMGRDPPPATSVSLDIPFTPNTIAVKPSTVPDEVQKQYDKTRSVTLSNSRVFFCPKGLSVRTHDTSLYESLPRRGLSAGIPQPRAQLER